MADVQATSLRKGMGIVFEGSLYRVLDFEHRTPGNKRAFVQTKLRNLSDGTQREVKFSSTDSLERAVIQTREMEYLYAEAMGYVFMDTETYDQITIHEGTMQEAVPWLTEGLRALVEIYEGRPIGVQLPKGVEAVVAETEPVVKGQTASSSYKPATLENGVRTLVPPHIASGTRVVINTEDGSYVERAKD